MVAEQLSCMDKVYGCLSRLLELIRPSPQKTFTPMSVVLNSSMKGSKADISRYCLSGTGSALATVCIDQECAYWEVEVVTMGTFRVGLSQQMRGNNAIKLDGSIGDKIRSWALNSSVIPIEEKCTIGLYFDQRDKPTLKFSLNGEMLDETKYVSGIKGEVFPAASIEKDAILRFRFDENSFKYAPADKYKCFGAIIPARNVI